VICEKKKAILLSKYPQRWTSLFMTTLEHGFDVELVYATELLSKYGSAGLVEEVNRRGSEKDATVVFIEVDFFPAIDGYLVRRFSFEKKVLFTFDDLMFHERNAITAALGNCDLVLTADPVSALKYEEKQIHAHLLFHDTTAPKYDREKPVAKTTDVLFFGSTAVGDRRVFIDYLLRNGVQVRVVGGETYISQEALVEAIRASKIILNLSKTFDAAELSGYGYSNIPAFSSFLQLKLRIVEAGLLGVACVSEYAPAIQLMFSTDEVPVFHTKEECLSVVRMLLADEHALAGITENLHRVTIEKYESVPLLRAIANRLPSLSAANIVPRVPFSYHCDTLLYRVNSTFSIRNWRLALREITAFDCPEEASRVRRVAIRRLLYLFISRIKSVLPRLLSLKKTYV
jgi:hypothetical protein